MPLEFPSQPSLFQREERNAPDTGYRRGTPPFLKGGLSREFAKHASRR